MSDTAFDARGGSLLPPDSELGPWMVLQHLGDGSTGSVYRARRDEQVAAVKVLRVRGLLRPGHLDEVWEGLDARLTALAGIRHPAVLRILDWGRVDETATLWLAMEELFGASLPTGPRLPDERALGLLVALAAGLHAAHAVGEVHGDIKPENLFVEPDGRAVLVDFALPLHQDDDAPFGSAVPLGSPMWLAPECFGGANATAAGDIYALGQTVLELLTGRPAFANTGRGPAALLDLLERKLASGPLDPGAAVPDPLRQALILSTHPDPAVRPSAAELASLVTAQ